MPLKVVDSPYREVTGPSWSTCAPSARDSPRDVVAVFIPEYVVGHWWENLLHNQSALWLKSRLLFTPGVMVTSVPWQLSSSARAEPSGPSRPRLRPPRRTQRPLPAPGCADPSPLTAPWSGTAKVTACPSRVLGSRFGAPKYQHFVSAGRRSVRPG